MDASSIRDRIAFNSNIGKLREPSFLIINALQSARDTAAQVEALFLTAAIIAQTLNLDPHAMIVRARRQIADAEAGKVPLIDAIRDYAKGELA
jgi:hypothetical protein